MDDGGELQVMGTHASWGPGAGLLRRRLGCCRKRRLAGDLTHLVWPSWECWCAGVRARPAIGHLHFVGTGVPYTRKFCGWVQAPFTFRRPSVPACSLLAVLHVPQAGRGPTDALLVGRARSSHQAPTPQLNPTEELQGSPHLEAVRCSQLY